MVWYGCRGNRDTLQIKGSDSVKKGCWLIAAWGASAGPDPVAGDYSSAAAQRVLLEGAMRMRSQHASHAWAKHGLHGMHARLAPIISCLRVHASTLRSCAHACSCMRVVQLQASMQRTRTMRAACASAASLLPSCSMGTMKALAFARLRGASLGRGHDCFAHPGPANQLPHDM